MKKLYIFLAFLSVLILTAVFFLPRAHKWARAHVNYMTATEDHPLLCINCHLYRSKSGLVHSLVNAKYYSPFDLAVSDDGKNLYVVAEEGNSILIVDAEKRKVTGKIKVGEHPYGIVLNKEGDRAYVSNQWGANVFV